MGHDPILQSQARHLLTLGSLPCFVVSHGDLLVHSDLIEAHNTANDGATFTLGHNAFSHLSWEEFKQTVRGEKGKSTVCGLWMTSSFFLRLFILLYAGAASRFKSEREGILRT